MSFDHYLLDERMASLDTGNRDVAVQLMREKKVLGVAIVSIFHDSQARHHVGTREIDLAAFSPQVSPETAACRRSYLMSAWLGCDEPPIRH